MNRSFWLLRRIRIELAAGQLVLLMLYAGSAYAAVTFVPPLFNPNDQQGVLIPAEVPEGWPMEEFRPPDNAWRTALPAEYLGRGSRFHLAGARWDDPLNYGRYPELWMVSFKSDQPPEAVFADVASRMHWPLYRLEQVQRTRTQTRYFWQYCDGSTLLYMDGPGPYATEQVYTLRILIYDN